MRTKKAFFKMKLKSYFVILKGLSLKQIKDFSFGKWESDFKREQNLRVSNTYTKMKLKQRAGKKHRKRRKTKGESFPKEQVENADLAKPVLNQIVTTHE